MNVDWTYQAIMGCAIGTGYLLSRRSQKDLSIQWWQRAGILMGAFCGAMIGAKLPFLFSELDLLVSGVAWFQNGKTILCGLVGGYAGVEIAKWSLEIRTKTGDSFAVPVAAAVGVGRLSCFWAGCCYGVPTELPWGVVFPSVDEVTRHPTQLYESAFHLSAAVGLAWLASRELFKGNLIKLYIICYAVYRLLTETIRPEARLLGGMTAYQWASLAIIALFTWLWIQDRNQVDQTPQQVVRS